MTKIRSVRVLSAAKVNALLYGILGLLIAPFLLLGPGLAMVGGVRRGFGGAVVVAAILPFFYGCIGFIAGAIMAFIYNAISHAVGGLEVELELTPPAILNAPQTSLTAPMSQPLPEVPPPAPPEFE
ncbi:MAG TPA: hypothetical protein VFE08_12275 [Candidatus Sulfotelmatobacter sp.]|nr:hypothetical protein [Candidatus Sulfotelmatobacter sp.]